MDKWALYFGLDWRVRPVTDLDHVQHYSRPLPPPDGGGRRLLQPLVGWARFGG